MSSVGFSAQLIALFESYFSNRGFQANMKNKVSVVVYIKCGVPQRPILGPLLFLIYINDMFQAVDCDLFLYAGNSSLVYQHKGCQRN